MFTVKIMDKIAVISFSGGLDSTSLLLNLISKNYKVHALLFNYGQKHKIELIKAEHNINFLIKKGYNIDFKLLDISDAISILKSSLTNDDDNIPYGYYKSENMKSTVVPNRNAIFTSFAYAFALTLNKKYNTEVDIALGVHSGDHEIYPDCREGFYKKLFIALREGNWDSENINLHLPYLNFTKSEIIKDAINSCRTLNLDFKKIFTNTITSYEPNSSGISNGKTASDIERILAFHEVGIEDPLKYSQPWPKVLSNAMELEKEYRK